MKIFKFFSSLALFIFLACSCSQIFYADFDKDVIVSVSNTSPLRIPEYGQQWSSILHPKDGFNIVTKATYIAQRLESDNIPKENKPNLALQ
ncbi:hypothetical protein WJR50_02830 [Catalinimonas sp. 4WD22]|uniref:hypothetical protein n=1 Tax=Catalinimonas locisalis TaxID=3133978 RepID=UPI00310179F2